MRSIAWSSMLALALAFASNAEAATYYVDGSSSSCSNSGSGSSSQPYCAISAAMTAHAGAGATFLVKPGVYREMVTVSASGTASSPFIIQATGPGVIVDGSDDFSATSLWTPSTGNVWLAASVTVTPVQVFADGARLVASPASTPATLPPRSWVWVSGQGLYVNSGGGNPGTHQTQVGKRSYGFRLDKRSWVTVSGFQVRNCESRDIYLTGPLTGTLISDNLCTFAAKNGIAALTCSTIVIRHNVCSDHLDHGIYFQYTVNSTVEDNESMRNARLDVRAANGMNLNRSTGNLIQRNRFHHNQDTGLDFGTAANNNLSRQNLLYLNGDHGSDHVDCSGNVHIGDVAYRNYKDGFSFEGSAPNHKVFNCIGIENGIAVAPINGTLEFDLWIDKSSIPGFQSDYNIWWNSTAAPPVKHVATRYGKLADYIAASGQDVHSVQSNPMFADTSVADFHVLDGSAAIDAGTSTVTDWPATDFDGRARWDDPVTPNSGAGPVPYAERGAYEFFANTKPVAALSVDVASGAAPLALTASGAASTDKDGKIVSYQFDFGDGTVVGPQASPTASHVYPIGEYVLTVTVTDNREGVDTSAVPIVVVPNLVGNPGFETNLTGWTNSGTATLAQVAGGHSGASAFQIKGGSSSSSTFGVDDSPNWLPSTSGAGSRYRFGAWVRSMSFVGKVGLEVREFQGTSQKGSTTTSSKITLSPTWQRVTVDYVVTTPGTFLDLHIIDTPTKSGETWLLDDVSIALVSAPPPAPPPVPGNLVANPGFETGIASWTKVGNATSSQVAAGMGGTYALQMTGSSTFGCDDQPNWVTTVADAGAKYRFAAWVRSSSNVGKVRISVLEYQGTTQQGPTVSSTDVALGTAWQQLVVDYTVLKAGSTLSMRVTDTPSSGTETFLVDDASIVLTFRPDRAPVVTAPRADTVLRGHPVSVTVTASDPDSQAIASLTADLSGLPAGHNAVFTPSADRTQGTLTWTPSAAEIRFAPYTVSFTAANALAGSATTALTVIDSALSGNLAGNPGFESSTTGWATNGSATLSRVSGGHSGSNALQIKGGSSSSAIFGADDSPNSVLTADRVGSRYRFGAWARSASFVGKVVLEVHELLGSTQKGSTAISSQVTLSPTWQYLTVDYVVTTAGTTLDLHVVDTPTKSSEIWFLDDVTVFLMSRPDWPPVVTAPESLSVLRGHPVTVNVSAAEPDSQAIASLTANLSTLPAGHNAVFTPSADKTKGTLTWTPTAADIRSAPYTVTFTAANALAGSSITAISVVDTMIALSGNLAGNPGFETNTTGWTTNGSATLSRVSGAHAGGSALQIKGGSSSSATFGADDSPNSVITVDRVGSRYRFGAWVRSASFVGKVALEVRELLGSTQKGATATSKQVTLSPTWQYLTVDYVVTTAGTSLDLRVIDTPTKSSEIWFLDDVTVFLMTRPDWPPVVTAPAIDSVMSGRPLSVTVTVAEPDSQAITSLVADLSGLPAGHNAVFTPSAGNSKGTLTWIPTAADIRSAPYNVTFTAANALTGSATTAITVIDPPPLSGNLAINSGFESNTTGWTAIGSATLSRVSGGHTGNNALQIKGGSSSSAIFGADDSPNSVITADRIGSRYRFGAWVRSSSFVGKVTLEVRELQGSTQVGSTAISSPVTLSSTWQHVTVDYVVTTAGSTLDLHVFDAPTKSSETWFLDDVTVYLMSRPDRPPVVTAPAANTVLRGHPVTVTVTAADPDTQAIASLTANLSGLPAGHNAVFIPSADRSSGTLTWIPTASAIRADAYLVSFTAANALAGSATTAITVIDTVIPPPPDRPPVVTAPASAIVLRGHLVTVTVTAADPDGQPIASLVADLIGLPAANDAVFVPDSTHSGGTLTWTPTTADIRATPYPVFFTAANALAGADTTAITVIDTVITPPPPPDRPPVVTAPAAVSVLRGHLVTMNVTAADPDSQPIDSLTADLLGLPAGNDAVFTPDSTHSGGSLTWTPAAADIRATPYLVFFTAANALAGADTTAITVIDTVITPPPPPDRPPVVTAPTEVSVLRGHLVTVNVTAADPDSQSIDSLVADLSALPAGNDAVFTPDSTHSGGTLTWTPTAADIRATPYPVTFTAANALAGADTTAITVVDTVITPPPPPDRPPVVNAPASAIVLRGHLVTMNVTAADPDSQSIDSLAADLLGLPAGNDAVFTPDSTHSGGTLTWTPTAADIRATPYPVTFTAGNALTGSATSAITVIDTADTAPDSSSPSNDNLVGNPGFETNLSGWGAYGTATLARVAGGHGGGYALQVTGSGSFGCDDVPNWVTTVAGAGAKYRVSAWVRSANNVGKVKIRVYEYQGTTQQGTTVYSQEIPLTTSWVQLVADYTVLKAGSSLSIRVTDAPVASSETYLVDDVSITLTSVPAMMAPGGAALQSELTAAAPGTARVFALGSARLGNADEAAAWSLQIQGVDGPGWEGHVPRVAIAYAGREVVASAGALRFGEDVDHDGIEEIGVDFDSRAVRAMLGDAENQESAEVTIVVESGAGTSWSAPFHLAIEPAPRRFAVSFAPNPMHADGALSFTLTRPGFARVDLYDASGRRVRRLFDRDGLAPGRFSVRLGSARGERLASGVYFYRVEAREGTLRGRIAIVR